MITQTELDNWATWLRAAGRPSTTIGLRTYHVRRVMADIELSPWDLTTQQLVDYLGAQTWGPETRRAYRASLRGFYTWAQATGRRPDNPALLIPTIKVPRRLPRPLPDVIYRQALAEADERVRLMLLLGAACGLRRGEISRIRREDVTPDDSAGLYAAVTPSADPGPPLVVVNPEPEWLLHVTGKGGRERYVPLPNSLAQVILAMPAGWIFPSPHRNAGPLTPEHTGRLVSAVLPTGWTCHTLRHRCATVALAVTKDLRAVQELLGHAKPETTAGYTLVAPAAVRACMNAAAAAAAA